MFPLQQPAGHEAALQTHWPPTHASPVGHEVPVQAQTPVAVHVGVVAGHDAQATPLAPHSAVVSLVSATQLLLWQQPSHELAPQVQAPAAHDSP